MCKDCYNDWYYGRNGGRWYSANRRVRFERVYGLTLEGYDELFAAQDGVCAICSQSAPRNDRKLSVDHVNVDGVPVVRGLLCQNCNSLLGLAHDSPAILCRAATYLYDTGTERAFRG